MNETEKEEIKSMPKGKDFAMDVGKRLSQALEKNAINQDELAQRASAGLPDKQKITNRQISSAGTGSKPLSFEKMARVAKALGVSLDYLAYGDKKEDQAAAQPETQEKTLRDYGQSMLDMIHDLGAELRLEDIPKEEAQKWASWNDSRIYARGLCLFIPLANFEASVNDFSNGYIDTTDDIEGADYIQPINIGPWCAPLQRFATEIKTASQVQNEKSKKIMIRNAVNDLPSDPLPSLVEKNKQIRKAQQKERNEEAAKRQQEAAQHMLSDDIPF